MLRIAPQDLVPLRESLVDLSGRSVGDAEGYPGGEQVRRVVHRAAQFPERGVALARIAQRVRELEAQIRKRRAEREGAPVLDSRVERPPAAHVSVADRGVQVRDLPAAEGVERLVPERVAGTGARAFGGLRVELLGALVLAHV